MSRTPARKRGEDGRLLPLEEAQPDHGLKLESTHLVVHNHVMKSTICHHTIVHTPYYPTKLQETQEAQSPIGGGIVMVSMADSERADARVLLASM